jgi:hypothetical protein
LQAADARNFQIVFVEVIKVVVVLALASAIALH